MALLGYCHAVAEIKSVAVYKQMEIPSNRFCQFDQVTAESRVVCVAHCSLEHSNSTSCCVAAIFNKTTGNCVCGNPYCSGSFTSAADDIILTIDSECSKRKDKHLGLISYRGLYIQSRTPSSKSLLYRAVIVGVDRFLTVMKLSLFLLK